MILIFAWVLTLLLSLASLYLAIVGLSMMNDNHGALPIGLGVGFSVIMISIALGVLAGFGWIALFAK